MAGGAAGSVGVMTRTGKLVLLGVVTVLVAGVGWFVVSLLRNAGASVAGPGPECTVALTAAAPATTLALSESSVVLSATGTVGEIPATAALTAGCGAAAARVDHQRRRAAP